MNALGRRQKQYLSDMLDSNDGQRWAFHAATGRVMESLETRGLVEWTGKTTYWKKRHRKEYRLTEEGHRVAESMNA